MTSPFKRIHFTTDRPVAVLMVFLAAVVFGYFSFNRLPVTLMPELTYPTITVRTEYPGAAPEEVENDISRPIEEALGVIGGLNRISSISRAGMSDVVLEFVWGTDMSDATQETLEKLDLVFLPREAEKPLILHFDPALDPIMELSFAGEGERYAGEAGLRRLRRIADLQIKRALEPIKGVAAVRVRGGLEEEIHVLLEADKLLRSGLSIQTVIDRLRQENLNVAGGTLREGKAEYMVRTLNEFENLGDIENTVVARVSERDLRVRDLGRVLRAQKDREILTRTDGDESVQIDIYKEADANMVAVAKAVTAKIGELKLEADSRPKPGFRFGPPMPEVSGLAQQLWQDEGATLKVVADRSKFIESSINEVKQTALMGGVLAVLILYLFLRDLKSTTIIAVSIPMSLLITFAPLNLLGVSLNIMSLGGLALGIGMLVDNSIVVLESIFRCRDEGDDVRGAAIRGTQEVGAAVVASTLTSVAVFFPLVFVEGIAGQAFGDLGLAVVISLIASLMVAIWFVPMLASRRKVELKDVASAGALWTRFTAWTHFRESLAWQSPWKYVALIWFGLRLIVGLLFEVIGKLFLSLFMLLAWAVVRGIAPALLFVMRWLMWLPLKLANTALNSLNSLYPRCVRWSLRNPAAILGLMAAMLYFSWSLSTRLQTELLPEVHQGEFTFEVNLPVGTPIEETIGILSPLEEVILENKDDIQTLLVTFGYDVTNMKRSDEGEHSARFKVVLVPGRDPIATEDRVMNRLRAVFRETPDAEVRVVRPVLFSSKTPIVVEINGDDLPQLKRLAAQAENALAQLPELADVETTLRSGAPEIQVLYHRDRLSLYGLNINTVAQQVRNLVKGFEATRFNLKDRRIPIMVRLDESDREFAEDIGRLTVNTGGIQPIPLESIARLQVGEGPSEVRRVDGRRVALVQANIAQGSLGGAVKRIEEVLRTEIDWPAEMDFAITGQNEEFERSKGSLYLALFLSLFLVYVIMAAQFESLLQPLIIMFTIPLAFFGSIAGLVALDISVSVVVFLGLIMLAGIVVNNAIVLIDYINTLRGRGLDRLEAIVTAGSVRLRPILMTTATTVLGLLPMALGLGDGAEIRTPMAITVICGLTTSTILTLIVIPTIYFLVDGLKEKFFKSAEEPAVAEAPAAAR
jgi:hydrophobic/amphiphilic exporter-1 (mainly G- bacteria), HAE1 family